MTAFGQPVSSSGSSSDPYGFAATSRYRNDGDAGLMLVGARYYDAQAGSFISRDTDLDQKPYGYCDADPVNATDPDGHLPKWLDDLAKGLTSILVGGGGMKWGRGSATAAEGAEGAAAEGAAGKALMVASGACLVIVGVAIVCYAVYEGYETYKGSNGGGGKT